MNINTFTLLFDALNVPALFGMRTLCVLVIDIYDQSHLFLHHVWVPRRLFFFFFFYRKPLGSSRFSLQKRWLQPLALAQSLCRSDVCVGLYFKVGHCWLWFTVAATRHMKCFPSAMQDIPREVDDAGQEFLKSCWDLNPESICWIWNKAQIMQIVGSLSMGVGDSGECFWLLSGLGKSLLPG